MTTTGASVFDAGAVWGTAFVTAFAAIVSTTVPGEHPDSVIEYEVPLPEGVPIVQVELPEPESEKSDVARSVTDSEKVRS
jgi:hypothetical protein